jgi:hypothetical protein
VRTLEVYKTFLKKSLQNPDILAQMTQRRFEVNPECVYHALAVAGANAEPDAIGSYPVNSLSLSRGGHGMP